MRLANESLELLICKNQIIAIKQKLTVKIIKYKIKQRFIIYHHLHCKPDHSYKHKQQSFITVKSSYRRHFNSLYMDFLTPQHFLKLYKNFSFCDRARAQVFHKCYANETMSFRFVNMKHKLNETCLSRFGIMISKRKEIA